MAHGGTHSLDPATQAALDQARVAATTGGGGAPAPTVDPSLDVDQRLLQPIYLGPSNTPRGPAIHADTRDTSLPRRRSAPAPASTPWSEFGPGSGSGGPDRITTVADAYDEFHRMSESEQRAFAKKLERAGVIEPGNYNYSTLVDLWRQYVDETADLQRATGKKITPEGYLKLQRSISGAADADGPSRDRSTTTDSNVRLSNRSSSRAMLSNEFQRELGRDPSRKEVKVFFRALNTAERARPATSTSTSDRRSNGNPQNSKTTSSLTSSSREGLDPGAYAQNYVDDTFDKEQDSRMAATGFYDALLGLAEGGS